MTRLSVYFISILLEAFPFILLGTIISSLIEVLLPSDFIEKRFGKKYWYSYFLAGLIGFIFPVCECAIVPIMRRLVKKGLPLSIGITLMLAIPIVNPVVLLSTYYAFSGNIWMVVARGGFGYGIAIFIGFILKRYDDKNELLGEDEAVTCSCELHSGEGHNLTNKPLLSSNTLKIRQAQLTTYEKVKTTKVSVHQGSIGSRQQVSKSGILSKAKEGLLKVIDHTVHELLDVGRYLIMGAFITAMLQTFVDKQAIMGLGQMPFIAIALMMLLAFVLSLCSEADAFIAASFSGQFSTWAILAFLVYGPMMDIKNMLMLYGSLKEKYVTRLMGIVTLSVFVVMTVLAFVLPI